MMMIIYSNAAEFTFPALGTTVGSGDFDGSDLVFYNGPLEVINGVATPLADFIVDINTSAGILTFSIDSVTEYTELLVNGTKTYSMGVIGNFFGEDGSVVGSGAMNFTHSSTGALSGSLDVKEVPTPAAVLPIVAGLFGAASRKKQEEEA